MVASPSGTHSKLAARKSSPSAFQHSQFAAAPPSTSESKPFESAVAHSEYADASPASASKSQVEIAQITTKLFMNGSAKALWCRFLKFVVFSFYYKIFKISYLDSNYHIFNMS